MSESSKINCCFADAMYKKYQNDRFGINYCINPEDSSIEELEDLKAIHDYYEETERLLFVDDLNFTQPNEDTLCNISSIKELINRI